jgi:O-antigen/teichoic acid export membrane protein
MKHKQIFWNAATTMVQVIGSAGSLFILYRFLIRTIGIEKLGIWSLVLATTSVVTLANQGFSTSIVKFVAKYAALNRPERVCSLIETAFLTIGGVLAVVCIALYPLAHWGLKLILPAARVSEAASLLPFTLASLWINIVGSILLAGLAGYELIAYRNYVVLGGSILYLLLSILWVPRHGLLGLAYAQTTNTAACFLATWYLLRRTIPQLSIIPRRWDRNLFREMWVYGVEFQFITVSQAVREPVTKVLLAKFGGLAMTGFYDMASRWVFTFRELIVQANLVLVPTISGLREKDPGAIPRIYRESYRLIFFLAVPTFAFLVAVSPVVSRVWLGQYEPTFVAFVGLLAMGWLINILSNPAYVVDLGTGRLRWVSIGCAVTGILNPALGYFAGKYLGGVAVVGISALSLAAGYTIVLVAYHLENCIPFRALIPEASSKIICASGGGVIAFFPYFCGGNVHSLTFIRTVSGVALALVTMIVLPMWLHPMRRRLISWASSRIPAERIAS